MWPSPTSIPVICTEIRLAILGEGHPDVVGSYLDVGFEYGELGDDEGYKEVMEKVDQILGNKNS